MRTGPEGLVDRRGPGDARPVRRRTRLLLGVGFAASDTMVAYARFVAPSVELKLVLMTLYWAAQALIAASARRS